MKKMVEVNLKEDSFLKIKETLTRIGIASKRDNTLYQSCHILYKKQKYYIVHFKEMFELDGKESNISEADLGRRNTICALLEEWGLLEVVDKKQIEEPRLSLSQIKVLSHKEKSNWKLVPKYNIGKKD